MSNHNSIKEVVKNKYGKIAESTINTGCCASCGCSETTDYSSFNDTYENMSGYVEEADLGLGCGLPTEFADIQAGDVVVDLGSGAGVDAFVARSLVGETGNVIGIDITPEMVQLAEQNTSKHGFTNVKFLLGDIEDIPLPEQTADVVISNCVLNLVPNKHRAFSEIYRILKPGAHFCISDVVIQGILPPPLKESAELYAGCVAGALQKDEYLEIVKAIGFREIRQRKIKRIDLPDHLLSQYLNEAQIADYHHSGIGIFSITITGTKPA
jgi:ubiquinone/menaquinone biosynthesis C-methylase UbiE